MLGIGTDICEVQRFDRLKENRSFLERIYSEKEIKYCGNRKASSQCFAARFAAKEAFAKALGTGIRKGIHLKEIEIENDELGKPFINLSGETKDTFEKLGCRSIHISISHEKTMAIAMVVIE
jgi:holo-[acyl-carrier protein] synthase